MFHVAEFQQKRTGRFGSELHYFEELESTNLFAGQLAREGSGEGTVVVANSQTQGRGRSGKFWFSPPDVNLYLSLILRPHAQQLKYLPFMAALAVIRVLRTYGLKPDLKWPNDVLVKEKKICGILIQTAMEENVMQFAVVGCGINVNSSHFPQELQRTATSIAGELGYTVSRESILAFFLLEFERLYEKIDTTSWEEFCPELERNSSYLRGCEVRVEQNGQSWEGETMGLDSYGGLVVETNKGRQVFYAGEIQSCRRR